MISYLRDTQDTNPSTAVKIVGLGGAGANMLERIALDGLEGAELLALNTDVRTLGACLAKEKIQLGANLTKGLGTGGDPELGQQAVLEAEKEVRDHLKGQRIVFLCTGLGGGTGSGAAPIVSRIAREEGAFVVVFATMPFFFEGRRRREQAETALNQLAVLSNALVTFDNNRMGELVLAKQGIHEAFSAADRMISESIKAVIRLVVRPGLINIGLDDLMSALRTTRSRCLFGSGIADGKDRASKALRNALSSPLLDQGSLLEKAQTVLVHLSGGESLTLFEIELLMRSLQKHVPESAHVLFGAAIDPAMGDNLSITLISALPEDALATEVKEGLSFSGSVAKPLPKADIESETESPLGNTDRKKEPRSETQVAKNSIDEDITFTAQPSARDSSIPESNPDQNNTDDENLSPLFGDLSINSPEEGSLDNPTPSQESETGEKRGEEHRPFAEFHDLKQDPILKEQEEGDEAKPNPEEVPEGQDKGNLPSKSIFTSVNRSVGASPPEIPEQDSKSEAPEAASTADISEQTVKSDSPELKLGAKTGGGQSELSFEGAPRGRFEGENPNVVDGEDLDLPPFLRKKKS